MENLSQAIDIAVSSGSWKAPSIGDENNQISHLFFADDLILFAEATVEHMKVVENILNDFCQASGHRISKDKSQLFFSPNLDDDYVEQLSNVLDIPISKDLGRYLGVLIIHGRVTKATYSKVLNAVATKARNWSPCRTSLARRVTLCKSVLNATPLYTMQTTTLPKGICNNIDKVCRQFPWWSTEGSRKISLVPWENVCQPKGQGGLGMKRMYEMNVAFLMKIGWGFQRLYG
ncbi:hypothetical protein Syun_001790 [Stephania yunnanensis]|uniref:Reverse transcriptase domain-containing protein n=1 Tax=Stephania yunnanensis TaxID=152371 RepID=A0AAP0LHD5_9MAGN